MPYIHSVISLLTISAPYPAVNAPLEHVSLHETYVPYLTATQITPLQVIQALLPLLRTGSARSRDKGKNSIIVCLPATDAHAGLPFASVQAMSAAGTLRGVEVLRREIRIAALTDKSESMRNIKVVVVDVGNFDIGVPANHVASDAVYKTMESWTASEKLAYGPAFVSTVSGPATASSPRAIASATFWERIHDIFGCLNNNGVHRKRTDLTVFANTLVEVVSEGRHGFGVQGLGIGVGRLRYWLRGERFAVGAGGKQYFVIRVLRYFLTHFSPNVSTGVTITDNSARWVAKPTPFLDIAEEQTTYCATLPPTPYKTNPYISTPFQTLSTPCTPNRNGSTSSSPRFR